MNLLRSFAFKNSILYLIVFFLAFGIFGYLLFKNSSERIVETVSNELQHRGDLVEIQTLEYYNELISSLDYLTYNPILENYLNNQTDQNYNLLAENYLSLLKAHSDFAQIRYIDARSGMEVIRVERNLSDISIINKTQLQNKKDRPYFAITSELKEEDIYISPIDLNKEFGKISEPRMPTLRLARVVYNNGVRLGVVVININLNNLFASLNQTVGDEFTLHILNENGYYLVHDNMDSTFLFEFEENQTRSTSPNGTFNNLDSKDKLMHSRRFQNALMTYGLVFKVIADKEVLLETYFAWRKKSILIMILTVVFLTFFSFLMMIRQSKKFSKITESLRDFPNNRNPSNVLIQRKDEFGDMARSFGDMASVINIQMDTINSEKLKAEEAVLEKSKFIENISHEIRNPLQSIMGLSTMLEKNNPNPNQLDILNSLKFNTSNLQGLVNNVLDYQNVIKGNITVEYSWEHITQVIEEVVMGNKFVASEKKIQLQMKFDEKLSCYQYYIDRLRLYQILANLISNAIKFTNEGGCVTVNCMLELKPNKHYLTFLVVDNGVGMTDSEVLKIKERYFTNRGIQTLNSNYGIGLTIVTELLHLIDSELEITSEKGQGSKFKFTLNLDARENLNNNLKDAKLLNLESLHLLIIEDDKQIVELYKHLLSQSNSTITFIEDVKILNSLKGQFDVIVADYRFAKKSLLDVRHLLENFKKPETVLLIASGSTPDIELFENMFKNVSFIKKPFSNLEFKQSINQNIVRVKYGVPNINRIKADYDYQEQNYMRALNILIDEWVSISNKINNAIESNDSSSMESSLHKFVTTLKRLDLHKLAIGLDDVKTKMPLQNLEKSEIQTEVKFVLNTILQEIKSQI